MQKGQPESYYQHFHLHVTGNSLKCENWASVQYFTSAHTCTMKPLHAVSKGCVIKNNKNIGNKS